MSLLITVRVKLYIDGILVQTAVDEVNPIQNSSANCVFRRYGSSNGNPFNFFLTVGLTNFESGNQN
jgi:hypothetical protein